MSQAMYAAIKKRKASHSNHVSDHGKENESIKKSADAPEQKSDDAQNISKGHASPKEKEKIQERMTQDASEPQGGAPADYDRDQIAMDMLDSKFRNGVPEGMKPRNLSDRMKMHVATDLKSKGKL